jgi:threonine synthase
VNSINWARVLAQVVYYFTAAVSLGAPHRAVSFTVPTGNFGDIFAGHIARRMGLPIEKLVVATNQNDILHRALSFGRLRKADGRDAVDQPVDGHPGLARISSARCSMPMAATARRGAADGRAEGNRRLHHQPGRARQRCASLRLGPRVGGGDPRHDRAGHPRWGAALCPHTPSACMWPRRNRDRRTPMITLATAHPAKFPDAVEAATGIRPALPPHGRPL